MALVPMTLLAAKRPKPVAAVASDGFRISTAQGSALEPFMMSVGWSEPQPQITRAVIIFHGKGRDVEGNYRTAVEASNAAGAAGNETVFIAPQFLDQEDIGAHSVPADVLRWRRTDWESGVPAVAPTPISSYEVVDALLARLYCPPYWTSDSACVIPTVVHANGLRGWSVCAVRPHAEDALF